MGEHESWPQPLPPSGLLPNGLLPDDAASVMRVLDMERWLKAEERIAELIASIQPNPPSEDRRHAVADYVQRLITKCFPCQVGASLCLALFMSCGSKQGVVDLNDFPSLNHVLVYLHYHMMI